MWYYEEWTALGRWSPRTEPSQPSAVTASGSKRKIRAVREVPENMTGYDLNVLRDWSDAMIAKETAAAAVQTAMAEAFRVTTETVDAIPEATEEDFKRMRLVTPAERVRHIKRGSTYRVIGRGKVQTDAMLFDDEDVVIYRGEADGNFWVRKPGEFDDPARFEVLPSLPDRARVKPLSWREIDPGHRLVGTGLGFTCEIHHLHKGGWEAIWPLSNAEFPDALAAKAAMEDAYAALVLSFVVLP